MRRSNSSRGGGGGDAESRFAISATRSGAGISASDYGQSAADLETLRRLVAAQFPGVGFAGHSASGAKSGEYSFRPVQGQSVWVQAPSTPAGQPRCRIGLWRFRLGRPAGRGGDPWQHANSVQQVVDWICAQAGCG